MANPIATVIPTILSTPLNIPLPAAFLIGKLSYSCGNKQWDAVIACSTLATVFSGKTVVSC